MTDLRFRCFTFFLVVFTGLFLTGCLSKHDKVRRQLRELGLDPRIPAFTVTAAKDRSSKVTAEWHFQVEHPKVKKIEIKSMSVPSEENFMIYSRQVKAFIKAQYQQVVPPYGGPLTGQPECPKDLQPKFTESGDTIIKGYIVEVPTTKRSGIGTCDREQITGLLRRYVLFCKKSRRVFDLTFYLKSFTKETSILNISESACL